eukprot:366160-Chlamydomonas_euryale.AAC.2
MPNTCKAQSSAEAHEHAVEKKACMFAYMRCECDCVPFPPSKDCALGGSQVCHGQPHACTQCLRPHEHHHAVPAVARTTRAQADQHVGECGPMQEQCRPIQEECGPIQEECGPIQEEPSPGWLFFWLTATLLCLPPRVHSAAAVARKFVCTAPHLLPKQVVERREVSPETVVWTAPKPTCDYRPASLLTRTHSPRTPATPPTNPQLTPN